VTARPLPFVIGILANLSGSSKISLTKFKERCFVWLTPERLATFPKSIITASTHQPPEGLPNEKEAAQVDRTCCGIRYLANAVAAYPGVKIKVLDAPKREVLKDIQRASEFDQTVLFKLIYEQELGTFGGEPFGCLLLDYSFSRHPEDIELLEKFSNIAATARIPLLIGLEPDFFFLNSWEDFNPEFQPEWLNSADYNAKWNSFRQSEDSRHVFAFMGAFASNSESATGPTVLSNPVYLIAALAGRAFRETNLQEIGTNLFSPGEADVAAWLETGFEWNCGEAVAEPLAAAGLNSIPPRLLHGWHLRNPVSLQMVADEQGSTGLAQILFLGAVNSRLRVFLRNRTSSGSRVEFDALLDEGLQELGVKGSVFPGPLKFERMEHSWGGVRLTLLSAAEFSPGNKTGRFEMFAAWRHLQSFTPSRSSDDDPLRFRILAILQVPGQNAGYPWTVDRRDPDALLGPKSKFRLTVDWTGGVDGAASASIELQRMPDFEPENLAHQIAELRSLYEERRRIVQIAAHANLSVIRSKALDVLSTRPGALTGIAVRLEAWRAAKAAGADSPVSADEIDSSIPGGIQTWDIQVDWESAFETHDRIKKRFSQAPEGVNGIPAILEWIDETISSGLLPVLHDQAFHRLESTCRAINWLAQSLPERRAQLLVSPIGWHPYDFRMAASYSDQADADEALTLYIIDAIPSVPGLPEVLETILKSIAGRRALVILAANEECAQMLDSIVNSDFAGKLLIVCPTLVIHERRKGFAAHPAFFEFNRGATAAGVADLRCSAAYQIAAAIVQMGDAALAADDLGPASLQTAFDKIGLPSRPFGRAILIPGGGESDR
jgi:predicted component of type VI protein secretion system